MVPLKLAALTLVAILAAGCSTAATSTPTPPPTHSLPPITVAATPTPTHSSPPITAAATPTASITRVPMQTAAGGEFYSPSRNISCELDYHRSGLTQAYCQTVRPSRSVTMDVTGRYTTCAGHECLGNPGTGTPILAYGTATGVGPFLCVSATTGVTCTAGGKGFQISTAGITPV